MLGRAVWTDAAELIQVWPQGQRLIGLLADS
jgi:hypothetical protein